MKISFNNGKLSSKVLYDNVEGSIYAISLNDSVKNNKFRYVDIEYKNPDGYTNTVRVYDPQGKNVTLNAVFYAFNDKYCAIATRTVTIDDKTIRNTSIRNDTVGEVRFSSSGGIAFAQVANIYITKVVGYY